MSFASFHSAPDDYDLIVVGSGIQGIMLALEASHRGLSVLLLERADWGAGTTANWLRILHGGLRYLQSADLPRFYESVRERSWFLEQFPEFVVPLPCIMPLYKTASRSPLLMSAALATNHVLSVHRNRRLSEQRRLPAGGMLTPQDVRSELNFVETAEMVNGALWYDGLVVEPQRLLIELLRWASLCGACAVNYAEVIDVHGSARQVSGVTARCVISGKVRRFTAARVVSATGHWSIDLAKRIGLPIEPAPRLSWAWNALFDVPSEARSAAAVSAREPGAQVFFVIPWQGRTLVGTGHAFVDSGKEPTELPEGLVQRFIDAVNQSVPKLELSRARLARVFCGFLPASGTTGSMKLTNRPLIVNHDKQGFAGLYSLWGIKYTTSRALARKVLRAAFGKEAAATAGLRRVSRPHSLLGSMKQVDWPGTMLRAADLSTQQISELVQVAEQTGVEHLDDLLLRRCGLGDFPENALEAATIVASQLPWTEERRRKEIGRLAEAVRKISAASGT